MCGIFALFLNRPLAADDIALGRAGIEALHHRGPGGQGEWIDADAGVFLGHTRLATFDPHPVSDQPMEREGDVIIFNGEIFNFRELRDRLAARGAAFSSKGDTEVLLRGWQAWGQAALNEFDGPFAFACWDGHVGHVAVDCFGEKPLFLAELEDGVYLCSELEVLTRLLSLKPDLSGDRLTAFLALGFIPPPKTAFPEVRRVAQATTLEIRNGAVAFERRFWRAPEGEPGRGTVQPLSERDLDKLWESILDALSRRVIADVPLCLFLSSGVDSSLVAAMSKMDLGVDLDCLTISFAGASEVIDEGPPAQAIAKYLGLNHRILRSTPDPGLGRLSLLLDLFGQPCDAGSTLALLQMSQEAVGDYTIALGGAGADEICFGFGKNIHFYRHRHLYALPEPVRRLIGAVSGPLAKSIQIFETLGCYIGVSDAERYPAWKNFPAISWLRGLDGFSVWASETFGGDRRPIEFSVPALEINLEMPGIRNVSIDVGTMRKSFLTRSPFMCRGVAEAVAQFDPRALMAFGQKSVLRRLLARYLPGHLTDHAKRGFVFPAADLLSEVSAQTPVIPSLSAAWVEAAWSRRHDGQGWNRIAVRLASAAAFSRQHAVGNT